MLVIISIRVALVIVSATAGFALAHQRAGEATNRREVAAYMDGYRLAAGG